MVQEPNDIIYPYSLLPKDNESNSTAQETKIDDMQSDNTLSKETDENDKKQVFKADSVGAT